MMIRASLLAVLCSTSIVHAAAAQVVVRGRVAGPGDAPIAGATVTVTPPGTPQPRSATTTAGGTYSMSIPQAADVYSVSVTAVGFAAQRREVRRSPGDSVIVANFSLVASAAQLPRVQTVAERPRPSRSDAGFDNSIGGQVSFPDVAGGLTGDVTGDFAAAMNLMPGISVTPDGAGGAAPGIAGIPWEGAAVLNGMAFGGSIPRDGFRVGVVSSAYDAGRGGFAGTQVSLRMASGANLVVRNMHSTIDIPALQWTTPGAQRLGSRYSQQVVSGQAFGPLKTDRSFYSMAYQLSRRAGSAPSLLSADAATLRSWHASPDSLNRFLSTARSLGIPTEIPGFSNQRETNEGRIAIRLDYSPNPSLAPSLVSPITAVSDDYFVEFGGSWRSTGGAMIGPSTVPSTGGKQTHGDGWAQATIAKYLPRGLLGESSVSFGASSDRVNPYVSLPSARVLVPSVLDDGSAGLAMYQAGGNAGAPGSTSTWNAEARGQVTRMSWDRHQTTALTVDGIVEHASITQDASHGSFTYNSLADLAANRAATFLRTLRARDASADAYQLALGLGNQYQPGPTFRAQYGVRLEANGVLGTAAYNPTVDSAFGRRTDARPTSVAVLPMAGFAWQTLGYIPVPQIGNSVARGFITGGIRRYRGTMSSRLVANTIQQSGLSGGAGQVFCVGAAAPQSDWTRYAQSVDNIPTQCVASTTPTLAESAPPVAMLASDYRPVSSWRSNVNINYRLSAPLQVTLSSTYALNRDLPGAVDLNFNSAVRSTLASEGGRPLYVPASSIVSSTGAVAWAGSRLTTAASHVAETRSVLHADVGTHSIGLAYAPVAFGQPTSTASITYAYTSGREDTYGFTGTTAGDPTIPERGAVGLAAHAVTVSVTRRKDRWGALGIAMRAQSGQRFTPIVSGDINGDGYVNDRAFVFGPAASDTSVGHGMDRLFANASAATRDCLREQTGRVAGRNSCVAPWSIPTFTLSITPDPYRVGLGNRGSVNVYLLNVLAGLDQALHGSTHLRGWGQWNAPEPTLLVVRGFDPAANRFSYTVNPLFGSSSVYRSAFRAPFALTIDFKVELGPDRESQLLRGGLRTRAGERADSLSLTAVKAKIDRAVNPFSALMAAWRDSLGLTPAQVDSLRPIAQRYAATRDSVVTSLARFLSDRRGDYDGAEVRDRWHAAATAITRAGALRGKEVAAILTAPQMTHLRSIFPATALVTLIDLDPEDAAYATRGPIATLP